MKKLTVYIEGIDDEGRGRGSYSDSSGEFDVAVRGAFPGDEVRVQPERLFAARKLIAARAVEHLQRGPCHKERICAHTAPCPTCPLHGVTRSLAAEIKRGRIERALSDVGFDFEVDDMLFHPQEFGYRQKVKLIANTESGALRLGVYVPYSHDFARADECPYVQPTINAAIRSVVAQLNQKVALEFLANIKAMIFRAGAAGVALVCVVKVAAQDSLWVVLRECVEAGTLLSVAERIQDVETNSVIAGRNGRQIGPTTIATLEGGPEADPDSFCQSDPVQATRMYDLVAEFLTGDGNEGLFVDAYAGVGGFSRALLRLGARNIVAIEQAQTSLSALQQLGVSVVLKPMSQALASGIGRPHGLVVDPAKKGLLDDADPIAQLGAKRVVLVSCDPDAMARDLRSFANKGYRVLRILPVDLFGGTPAIEAVVFMSLDEGES